MTMYLFLQTVDSPMKTYSIKPILTDISSMGINVMGLIYFSCHTCLTIFDAAMVSR